jgi:hypothetical protein
MTRAARNWELDRTDPAHDESFAQRRALSRARYYLRKCGNDEHPQALPGSFLSPTPTVGVPQEPPGVLSHSEEIVLDQNESEVVAAALLRAPNPTRDLIRLFARRRHDD